MNLSIASNLTKFVNLLTKIESIDRRSNGVLTNAEREFVCNIRERFDGREDQADLGVTQWSPTVKQWNYLHDIGSRL